MGSPFDTATWNGITDSYYTGLGGGELLWLLISIAMCIVALWIGGKHEKEAYAKSDG